MSPSPQPSSPSAAAGRVGPGEPGEASGGEASLTPLEAEVVALFVGAVQLLGLPKSIGEIYGLLYLSAEPLPMAEIAGKLRISMGSASQGLKLLRSFKAVRATYVPGERRDFFVAETEFRKLAAGFFKEEVFPYIEATAERIDALEPLLDTAPAGEAARLRQRLDKLRRWHVKGGSLLKKVVAIIRF